MIGVAGVLVLLAAGLLVATRLTGDDDTADGPTQPSTAPNPTAEPTPLPSGGPTPSTEPSAEPSTEPSTTASTPATAAPRLTEATALATKFLGYVNASDRAHALALGCADSRNLLDGLLVFMIDPPTKLTVSGQPYAVRTYYPKISVPFSGTTKGPVPRTGTVDIMDKPPAQLCVRLTTMR